MQNEEAMSNQQKKKKKKKQKKRKTHAYNSYVCIYSCVDGRVLIDQKYIHICTIN